jgi:hypothetical protein
MKIEDLRNTVVLICAAAIFQQKYCIGTLLPSFVTAESRLIKMTERSDFNKSSIYNRHSSIDWDSIRIQ